MSDTSSLIGLKNWSSATLITHCRHGIPLYGLNAAPPPCRDCQDEAFEAWLKNYKIALRAAGHRRQDAAREPRWTKADLRAAWEHR